MQRKSGYLVGFGGAVAMLAFIASLEVEVAAARTGVQSAPINRMLKGDRLPVIPGASSARPVAAPEPKLPDECHATFSARKNAFSAEVPGRCIG